MADKCCLSSIALSHATSSSDVGGTAFAQGGTATQNCATTGAGTVKSCLIGCSTSVTITAGSDGLKGTVTFPPSALWNKQWGGSASCPPQDSSTLVADGGPNPPPCDIDPNNGGTGCASSPIIIDVQGEGFHLTSAPAGVLFDISGTGDPIQIAWTDANFHNAFLGLPGSDGLVHNGKELFGNFTPQPQSSHPNGFLALAEFDKPENGGNGDGVIDEKDTVFSQLRLWIDENHDGVSQPNELHTLPELGVFSLSLSYFESLRTDDFGNQFRYKARVNPGQHRDKRDETSNGEPGRWTYDVFFVTH
jgi:hypothetical protein